MSQEWIGGVVILLVSVLSAFGVKIGSEEVTSVVTGLLALWVIIRRVMKKDITVFGVRK